MFSFHQSFRGYLPATLCVAGVASLLSLQFFWLHQSYRLTRRQFVADIESAFDRACEKEQTYRIPVNGIVPQGNLTIESCGQEEIRIIRHCPNPDTVMYNNVYVQSMESVLNLALRELRESIIPLNLYCLSDLFAGELYERELALSFVIERISPATGKVHESSEMPGATHPVVHATHALSVPLSESESLRVTMQFSSASVFRRMGGELAVSFGLLLLTGVCVGLSLRAVRCRAQSSDPLLPTAAGQPEEFQLGRYLFNPAKNELQGVDQVVTLSKKDNALLYELCVNAGNVVGRNMLLEKYWEGTGFVYSRSLDTYVSRLRNLLSADPSVQIVTIKGVGYKLITQPS